MTMQPLSVGLRHDARHPEPYGLMPIGERQRRAPTIAEVVHFETCHAAGPYSAVNLQVPAWVPVWQYVDPAERAAAERKCATFAKASATPAERAANYCAELRSRGLEPTVPRLMRAVGGLLRTQAMEVVAKASGASL